MPGKGIVPPVSGALKQREAHHSLRAIAALSVSFYTAVLTDPSFPGAIRHLPTIFRKGGFMEMFSTPWWSALLSIALIDLVLAGDNAIVIALAARNLPGHLKRKAILWGTVGAIVVRSVMTLGVVWLLQIPGLMAVGGLCLLWIAYQLLADSGEGAHDGPSASTFAGAMKTIIVADALMGVDNVLGVAGAAHGAFDLVILGLLISVPIVVYGSTMVLRLVERFPAIIQLGAAVLAFTAAKMVVSEPLLQPWFGDAHLALEPAQSAARWAAYALAVVGVLAAGWWVQRKKPA
jgi:YjbE family integral membrane protein